MSTHVVPQLREPPHNLPAEQAVLGAVMMNGDAWWQVAPLLEPEMFFEPLHGEIYDAMGRLMKTGKAPVPTLLAPMFETHEALKAAGGKPYIARLAASAVSVIGCRDYAAAVREAWLRRIMIHISHELADGAHDLLGPPPHELADAAEARLHRALNAGPQEHLYRIGRAADDVLERAAKAYEQGEPAGLDTGLKAVDSLIGRMQPGDMIVLGGATSQGKTALAQQIALHAAQGGAGVAVFSLEMTAAEYTARHVAQLSGVPADRIEQGQFSESEYSKMNEARGELAKLPLIIAEAPRPKVSNMRATLRRLQRKHAIALVLIDHLHFVAFENPILGQIEGLAQVTRDIKALAKEAHVPVLLVSHLNRALSAREDKTPQLSDLHGSSAIEKDADVVFFIHRPEYWLKRCEPPEHELEARARYEELLARFAGKAQAVLAKRRRGQGVGRCEMHFDEAFTRFRDIDWRA